jgi:colicin import membrane protein
MTQEYEILLPQELLAQLEPPNALAYFTTDGHIEPLLAKIRVEIDKFYFCQYDSQGRYPDRLDMDSPQNRAAIASMAYKIARSKIHLETIGKSLSDEVKLIPKKLYATRKHVRDTLNAWQDEVRAPLDAWEKEKAENGN